MESPAAGVSRRTAADVSPRGLAAVRISTPQLKVCFSDHDDHDHDDDIQDLDMRAAPAGPHPMAAAQTASPRPEVTGEKDVRDARSRRPDAVLTS